MRKSYFFQQVFGLCLICLVAGLILVGCSEQGVGDKEELIRIGAILPLTGKAGNSGEDMRQAIDLAVEEINQQGKKLEVVFEDEKCEPKEAVTGYTNLISKNIKVIVGAGCSHSTLAVAPLAEQNKVILVTTSSADPKVSQAGDYVFRNHGIADFENKKLAEEFVEKYRKAVVVYDSTNDVFVSGHKAFIERWEQMDGEIKMLIALQGESSNYKTELLKIKSILDDVNTISLMGVTKDHIILMRQLQELDIIRPILADKSVNSSDYIQALGELAEGVVFVDIDFGPDNNPQFWQSYKEKYNEEPNIFAAQSYDTVRILFDIMSNKCQVDDTDCIKNELYKIQNYPGAAGLTSFDQNGDAQKPLVLKIIKNGEFVKLD